jgi:hypothetical protein
MQTWLDYHAKGAKQTVADRFQERGRDAPDPETQPMDRLEDEDAGSVDDDEFEYTGPVDDESRLAMTTHAGELGFSTEDRMTLSSWCFCHRHIRSFSADGTIMGVDVRATRLGKEALAKVVWDAALADWIAAIENCMEDGTHFRGLEVLARLGSHVFGP